MASHTAKLFAIVAGSIVAPVWVWTPYCMTVRGIPIASPPDLMSRFLEKSLSLCSNMRMGYFLRRLHVNPYDASTN